MRERNGVEERDVGGAARGMGGVGKFYVGCFLVLD